MIEVDLPSNMELKRINIRLMMMSPREWLKFVYAVAEKQLQY